jgi:uncharacterized protein (DUF302 family)
MPSDVASIKYSLREPFEKGLDIVCKALSTRGLRVTGQLDVSRRLERELGIVLPPCRVVFVLASSPTLSTGSVCPSASVFLPLHVVVSGNDSLTEIQVQNKAQLGSEGAAARALLADVVETQTLLAEAIDAIAMRASIVS